MPDTIASVVPDFQIAIPSIRSRVNNTIQDLHDIEIPIVPGVDDDDVEIWYCVDHDHIKKAIRTLREAQDRLATAERRLTDKLQKIYENH